MEDEDKIITLKEYVDAGMQSSAMILGGAENGEDICTYPMVCDLCYYWNYLPRVIFLDKPCISVKLVMMLQEKEQVYASLVVKNVTRTTKLLNFTRNEIFAAIAVM